MTETPALTRNDAATARYARMLTLLAPRGARIPGHFENVRGAPGAYDELIQQVQQFRGRIYAADGAIPFSDLDAQGRHVQEYDLRAWHIVSRAADRIIGVIRVGVFENPDGRADVNQLHLMQLLFRLPVHKRVPYLSAITEIVAAGPQTAAVLGEPGGWAVDLGSADKPPAVLLPVAAWHLMETMGHALCVATATDRHESARLLMLLGGFKLSHQGSPLPPIVDSYHRCEIELLGFNSRFLHPRFAGLREQLRQAMRQAAVLTPS